VNLDHLMLGREDQAAELGQEVLEGKKAAGRDSSSIGSGSGSDGVEKVPGEMPKGLSGGDMKPHGL